MADFPNPSSVTVTRADGQADRKPTMLIGDVPATLVQREDPSEPVQVTTHPVEQGESIADYAIDSVPTLTLDCKFYNAPNRSGDNLQLLQDAGKQLSTWRQARDAVLSYKRDHTIIDIFTGYALYQSYIIYDYVLDRRPETSECWSVSLMFQHVRFVDQQWAAVPYDRIPQDRKSQKLKDGAEKGAPDSDSGNKSAKEKNLTDEERESLLRKIGGDKLAESLAAAWRGQ